jgi:putative DNA primase/helicase
MTVHIHPDNTPSFSAESIAKALGNGKEQRTRTGWQTCCPAHEDKNPSLSIKDCTDNHGRPDVSVKCHAGCDYKAVKDALRARGLLPEWKPVNHQRRPLNSSVKQDLPAYIWKTSSHDQTATETIKKAFAFRSIQLEQIPPNIRLNNHEGKFSIACAMQSPLDENPPAKPQCVHLTLLDEEGKKKKRSETSPSTKYHGPKTGLVVLLPGKDSSSLVIGEGLETTLSAMQAMGFSGIVCGDAGNMAGMTKMREQFQEIFILVDSDTSHAGQNAALKAAESIGKANPQAAVWLVAPDDSCFTDAPVELDFNDLLKQDTSGGSIRARFERKKRLDEIDIDLRPKEKEQAVGPSDEAGRNRSSSLKNLLQFQEVLIAENSSGKPVRVQEGRAAELIAESLQGQFAFSDSGLCWHFFDGSRWRKCGAIEFDRALTARLRAGCGKHSFSSNYMSGIKKILPTFDLNLLPEPLPGSIPFKNGLLLHKTHEMLPVTPENAHTWVLPYDYTAEAVCPKFLEWLETALDGDDDSVRLIQAWFNALLTGRPDLQIFLHLQGPAGTGKSTLGRLAAVLVGENNTFSTKLKELENNRFETAGIYGKRLVVVAEADRYSGEVNTLKAVTGQDYLRLERKNQQQDGGFIYEGQTLLMSNGPLNSADSTGGIERRRITVKFNRTLTAEERAKWSKRGGEEKILHSEIPGIINWALKLSPEQVGDVFKTMPERVRLANLEAAMFNNPLMAWMLEKLLPDPGAAAQVGEKKEDRENGGYQHCDTRLYPNYLTWCKASGRESVSLQRFSETLLDAARQQSEQIEKKRTREGATKIFGLRIRCDFEESWLERLERRGDEDQAMSTLMKDNPLKLKMMKTMNDSASLLSEQDMGLSSLDSAAEKKRRNESSSPSSSSVSTTYPSSGSSSGKNLLHHQHVDCSAQDRQEAKKPAAPYLDDQGRLRTPCDCAPKYRWWQDGQSPFETALELGASDEELERHVNEILNPDDWQRWQEIKAKRRK